MLLSIGLDVIAFICSIKGIQLSDLSLIVPLSSFLPVFTIIFNAILFKEFPTQIKFIGIILIVIGVYVLNLKDIKRGFLKPIQDVAFNRGAQLFFFANLIWAITPIFQKQAILATFPQRPTYISVVNSVGIFSILLIILFIRKQKISISVVKKYSPLFLVFGVLGAASQYAAFTAFSLTNVAYPNAIFKLSTLITVIVGGMLLKEKNIASRIIATIIMLTGVILLIF
jgi:drug/metabolite transporter (DMT)-like permease